MKKLENAIYTNLPEIEMQMQSFEAGKPALQQIIDLIHSWNVGQVQSIEDLTPLLVNPLIREPERIQRVDQWIDEKIGSQIHESDIPRAGLFRLSKRNFVRMVDRPDPLPLVKLISDVFSAATLALPLAAISKGKIIMDKAKHDSLVESFTLRAETDQEKTALRIFTEICERLDTLVDMGALNNVNELARLKQAGFLAQTNGTSINPNLFRTFKGRLANG